MTASTPAAVTGIETSPLTVYHRGFSLALSQKPGRYGPRSFGFEIHHRGLLLHTSPGAFGTAGNAERAGRRFIDDALGAFEHAYAEADAEA